MTKRPKAQGPRQSHARPFKPPADVIHAHRSAALAHGGRLTPRLRRAFARAIERRTLAEPRPTPGSTRAGGLRAGKRVPAQPKKRRAIAG